MLLDYADARTDLDEIVFENRNKEYGAYDLRKRYAERVRAAILWSMSGLLALVLIPVVFQQGNSKDKETTVIIDLINPSTTVTPAPPKQPIEPKPAGPAAKPAPAAKPKPAEGSVRHAPLQVADDPEADTVLPQDSLKEKLLGLADTRGEKPAGSNSGNPSATPGGDGPDGQGDVPGGAPEGGTGVRDFVQDMPKAPYNYGKYLRDHMHYPQKAITAEVSGRVTVQFVVQPDGSITDVSVLQGLGYGCDEEAVRIVSQMPAWVPGKQNGTAVPVRIRLPIAFKLQ